MAGLVRRMDADTRTREAREGGALGSAGSRDDCSYGSTGSRLFASEAKGTAKGTATRSRTNAGRTRTSPRRTSESFAESRFAGESRKGERLDGTVRDRSRASPRSARQKRDKARFPRRRNSFAFDDDVDGRRRRERRERAVSPRLCHLGHLGHLCHLGHASHASLASHAVGVVARDVAGDGHRVSPDAGGSESRRRRGGSRRADAP